MNNRQANNNGRRRGRGGQQQRGGGSNQGNGNRIDNRARGNAAQLLEKYKNLARDAQMQGDRVNTEYYLQFADHYFRVLSESRSRFEENNPQQRRQRDDNDFDDDFGFEAEGDRDDQPRGDEGGEREERAAREDRGNRRDRDDRGNREERADRGNREDRGERRSRANGNGGNGHYAGEEEAPAISEPVEEAPRARRGRPRRDRDEADSGDGIASILPPALGASIEAEPAEEAVAEEKPKKRRTRRDAEASAA